MSANNRRIRRIIVDLLFDYGPMTKEGMADCLTKHKSVRTVPSPHSLSALMSKNPQVKPVGSEQVENAVGTKAQHLVYDIDRDIIRSKDDIMFTRSLTVMTPQQKKEAKKCVCSRIRVFPPKSDVCLHCIRKVQ
jgi:hypothetical protein